METISIVGGGIAGLALAACLDPARFDVTVYEKRPELPAVGTRWECGPTRSARWNGWGPGRGAGREPGAWQRVLRNGGGEPWITVNGGQMFAFPG